MPGRNWNATIYKYGFNGQEKYNELTSGDYDFGARILDSRIGRWLSTDPYQAKYPDMSPFNFAGNSPITFKDMDGKKIYIYYDSGNRDNKGNIIYSQYEYGSKQKVPDNNFVKESIAALEQIKQVNTSVNANEPSPSEILNRLATDDNVKVNIMQTQDGNSHRTARDSKGQRLESETNVSFNPTNGRVYLSIGSDGKGIVDAYVPPSAGLSHELKHGYNYLYNPVQQNADLQNNSLSKSPDKNLASFPNQEEYNTSMLDNSFLKYFGMGERNSYYLNTYKVNSATSNVPTVTPERILGIGIPIEIKSNKNSATWGVKK
jgi:RHS repeat-associated protein